MAMKTKRAPLIRGNIPLELYRKFTGERGERGLSVNEMLVEILRDRYSGKEAAHAGADAQV